MIRYGCMALVAMACSTVVPTVQAKGNFFVSGRAGQASYGAVAFEADTLAFSAGYRWKAGDISRIGIEAGVGEIDETRKEHGHWQRLFLGVPHRR